MREINPHIAWAALFLAMLSLLGTWGTTQGTNISIKDILELTGALISAAALVIGTYLAVLAVSAYGHVRDIESQTERVTTISQDIERDTNRTQKEMEEIRDESAIELIEILSNLIFVHQINSGLLKETDTSKRYILKKNELLRKRSFLAAKYSMAEKDRIRWINELKAVGKKDDILRLEEIREKLKKGGEKKAILDTIEEVICYLAVR